MGITTTSKWVWSSTHPERIGFSGTRRRFAGTGQILRGRRAFTLIELLVVISVIALLLALLTPALARARNQARAVTCQALLKEWGPIWYLYCNDNNGYFSSGSLQNITWPRGEWVITFRSTYETKSDIVRCPMATKRLPSGAAYGGPFNTYVMGDATGEEASFGQNCWLYNPPPEVREIQQRPSAWDWRTMNVRHAGEIPVFADTMWRGGGPFPSGPRGDPPDFNGQWINADAEMRHFCIDRHHATINHLFLDWSVRPVGIKELWTLRWHRQFDRQGRWTKAGGVQTADWPLWMRQFRDY
jgi:prepilin-type N-terminal cleavage/methylation domain-containing protein